MSVKTDAPASEFAVTDLAEALTADYPGFFLLRPIGIEQPVGGIGVSVSPTIR